MSLLVTGHKGFVGQYLMQQTGAKAFELPDGALVDLLVPGDIDACIETVRPDAVVHLAAQSSVPDAFADPLATYQANFMGTQHLLAALKKQGFKGRFLYVSTAEVYGQTAEAELPVAETARVSPLNPYAVSKLAAETLCQYWSAVEGMDVVIARPFNHIGPGQSPRFAIADFAKSMVEIGLGMKPPVLDVGDLDVTRDFTDVRDVIAAYLLLLASGQRGQIYNVCSGVEQHMAQAVQTLSQIAGVQVQTRQDPARFRKAGQRRSRGDCTLLSQQTGWRPGIGWQQSLTDIIEDWKLKLQ